MISAGKQNVPRGTAEITAWELAQVKRRLKEREKEQWQRHEAERRDWQPAAGPEEEGE